MMNQYLSNLRENFNNGLREFSEHPIQHSYSAVKDFVKNYWDLGAMVLAGFAFNDHGSEVFGDARFPVMLASSVAGLSRARNDTNRAVRNLYAGFASLCGFWTRGIDAPLSAELGNYGVAGLMSAASLYMDKKRREEQTARSENSQPQEPLEILVE